MPGAAGGLAPHRDGEGDRGHHEAHAENPLPQPGTEDAFGRGPGRPVHAARAGRLAAERNPGQAVGEQVHPQDLGGQQRQGQAERGPGEHHRDLRGAAGQPVEQEPADVVIDAAAFFGGGHHGGQVVVGQYQVGGLAGDLGAAAAHGHADVGAAQRRPVVDAVAGHRDHVPGGLPGGDDGQFLLRGSPGEYPRPRIGQVGARVAAIDDVIARAQDPGFGGDRACGRRVIPGDQHRGDARRLAGGDGGGRRGARRVHDADQADQPQAAFQVGAGWGGGPVGGGHGEHPESIPREFPGTGTGAGHGAGVIGDHRLVEQDLGGSLAEHADPAARAPVHGGHPFPAAVEGKLGHPRRGGAEPLRPQPQSPGRGQQRGLGRVANRRPFLPVADLVQRRVIAQRGPGQ